MQTMPNRSLLPALALVLSLSTFWMTPSSTLAQPAPPTEPVETGSPQASRLRAEAREILLLSRDLLGSAYDEVKRATKLNDDQLYGAGIGALGGLLLGNFVGARGLLSIGFIGAGAYLGQVIATPDPQAAPALPPGS